MERTVFVQHVLSAVGHLDEPAVLGAHPLAVLLFPDREREERGRALVELFRAAIGELRPTDVTETNLLALRRAQYLDLRYRQGHRAAHVAQELGLSDRQARRVHQEAIEALAGAIWARRPGVAATLTLSAADASLEPVPTSELDVEIARLGATPSVEGTSLGEALRSALGTIAPLAARHRVNVDVATLPPLPLVAIDRAVLRQVLVNLLVASIEGGARQIEVGVRPDSAAVEVTFTTPNVTTSVAIRTQPDELLGVVQRLVQLQAGWVEARTLDSTRSAIALSLPVLQPATILLVDDNPDTLRLFRRYLGGGGYRPIEASDGRQALELARQAQPRGIVLDVMLPSQDGWEILQALRNDLATERIPVVVCSVLHQEELALALGAAAYLAKPVSRDELLATLRRVLVRPALSRVRSERVG